MEQKNRKMRWQVLGTAAFSPDQVYPHRNSAIILTRPPTTQPYSCPNDSFGQADELLSR